jgi:hypothetical protein
LKNVSSSFINDKTIKSIFLNSLKQFFFNNNNNDDDDDNDRISNLISILSTILIESGVLNDVKQAQLLASGDVANVWQRVQQFEKDDEQAKQLIDLFLMSCVMKDCSIMITLQNINNNNNNNNDSNDTISHNTIELSKTNATITLNSQCFAYRVALVDLDAKRASDLQRYYALDCAIVDHYNRLAARNDNDSDIKQQCFV